MQVEGLWDPRGPHGRHGEGAPHRQHGLGPQVLEGGSARGLGRLPPLQLDEAGWLALLAPPPTLLHRLQALQLSGLALLYESLHHRGGVCDIGWPRVVFVKQIHWEPDVLSEFYWQRETGSLEALAAMVPFFRDQRNQSLDFSPSGVIALPPPVFSGNKMVGLNSNLTGSHIHKLLTLAAGQKFWVSEVGGALLENL